MLAQPVDSDIVEERVLRGWLERADGIAHAREVAPWVKSLVVPALDQDHPPRIRHRQLAKVHAIQKAEQRGVHAHRQRQTQHGGDGVARIPPQGAQCILEIHTEPRQHAPVGRHAHGNAAQRLAPVPQPAAATRREGFPQVAGDGVRIAAAHQPSQQ